MQPFIGRSSNSRDHHSLYRQVWSGACDCPRLISCSNRRGFFRGAVHFTRKRPDKAGTGRGVEPASPGSNVRLRQTCKRLCDGLMPIIGNNTRLHLPMQQLQQPSDWRAGLWSRVGCNCRVRGGPIRWPNDIPGSVSGSRLGKNVVWRGVEYTGRSAPCGQPASREGVTGRWYDMVIID